MKLMKLRACDVLRDVGVLIYFKNKLFLHEKGADIDLFHNGGQIKYSFVLMLISLTRLATMYKIQRKFYKDFCCWAIVV